MSRANGLLAFRHHVRRARHVLDAAGDVEVAFAELHRARRVGDRAHARRAQPIHRLARHGHRQSGEQQRHARDVAIVLARLVRAAEDDVGRPRDGSSVGLRRSSSAMTCAARSSARTSLSRPPMLPTAVRTPSTMYASAHSGFCERKCLLRLVHRAAEQRDDVVVRRAAPSRGRTPSRFVALSSSRRRGQHVADRRSPSG